MAQPGEWTTDRLAAVLSRQDPRLLLRMSAGIALLGRADEPPGSCVLVVDNPLVRRLTDLPRERRLGFLGDLDLLGEAVRNVCRRRRPGLRSVGLEVPDDGDLLHAHVCPRYAAPDASASTDLDAGRDLRTDLRNELDRISAAHRADYPSDRLSARVYHHLP